MFVRGVAEIAEVLVALKRLQNFLELDEKKIENISADKNGHNGLGGDKNGVNLIYYEIVNLNHLNNRNIFRNRQTK